MSESNGLSGIGTNILAARLRDLEAGGVIARRTLPPPAASRVYELTEYGQALKPVLRELGLWGARSLGPPTHEEELYPGWLVNVLDTVLSPVAPEGRFEFRVGDEIASLVDGEALEGPIDDADVVVQGAPGGVYRLFVEGQADAVSVQGDQELLERLVAVAPQPVASSAA